jgi:hypothetical protein
MAAVMLLSVGRLWKTASACGDAATSAANQEANPGFARTMQENVINHVG